jgi:hypothetical protein
MGMANFVAQWLSILDLLPAIAERIRTVQVELGDWLKVLEDYDTPRTLFYIDPPLVKGTRRGGKYRHEMGHSEHRELVEVLLDIQGLAVLSAYRSAIHHPLEEAGRQRIDLPTTCYAVGRTRITGLRGSGSPKRLTGDRGALKHFGYRPPLVLQPLTGCALSWVNWVGILSMLRGG